ncbi:MAG TPA: response regulator [Blastocatellia bacterium]|nr:response regulator [Blastocatellia bacterium]
MSAKILVVDDSGMSRRLLRRMLETAGHEVTEAEDGLSALELYFIERPALVLLDMVMQGMYGLEVLARLRELDPQARVIVATADIQASTLALAREAGACGLITKPFVTERVLEATRAVLAGGESWN